MEHNFNIECAKLYGVEESILLHNIYFWINKNKANKKHFYDGDYWTYNSIQAFTELFPYWTKRQIERIIKNLIEKGALLKGNYNKLNYDRTSWYAVSETVKSIYANREIDFTKRGNGYTQTVSPIPDNNTYNKYIYDYFIQIENLNEALKSFEGNKQYYFLAYKFWKLWQEENPNHQTIKKAKIESWYNEIRKMVEIDKTPIERILAIYSYFSKHNEIYIRDFWFKTIKSVGALRGVNKKGEYVIDRIIDEINKTIDINSDFEKYVNNLIKKHNESFRIY